MAWVTQECRGSRVFARNSDVKTGTLRKRGAKKSAAGAKCGATPSICYLPIERIQHRSKRLP
jgi:hypothetical protein